jgi:ATP-binding cassette subfamily C (CFTR/MRP) protein 2
MDFFAKSWNYFCSNSEGGAAGAGTAACLEHAIISGIHLGLIIVFLALALAYRKELRRLSAGQSSSCRRRSQQQQQRVAAPTRRQQQQQQLHWVVLCFMLVLGLGYAGSVIWAIGSSSSWSTTTSGSGGREFVYPIHELTLLLVQGLAFLCLALSVRVRAMTMTLPQFKTFVRVWWVLAFFLGTFAAIAAAVEVLNGARYGSLAVLELMSWPVCCLLLYCAIKDDDKDDGDGDDGKLSPEFDTLVEPLLDAISEDSEQQPLHNVTPFASAGFLSQMTFWWLNPLLSLGYKRPLEQSDMPSLGKEDETQTAYKSFAQALEDQKENGHKTLSIFWALTTCYWRPIAVNGLFAFGKSITLSLGPVVLKLFIDYTGGKQAFKYEGYILVVGLFLAKSLESISQRQWYFGSRRIGLQVRSALMAAIYRKELKLSNTGKNKHAGGDVVNYMSVDAYRIGEFTYWLHFVWTTVLQILIALVILAYSVGWATLSGLVVIILTMVVNTPMAKSQQKFLTQLMAAQDKRLQATAEALRSMKILKLQAWEDRFKEAIEELRKVEMKWLSAVQYRKAYNSVVFWVSPVLVSTATFFTCMLLGTPLTASNVFTALATLRIIQDPIRLIPDVIAIIIQVHVSLARIDRFLQEDELQADAVARDFQKSSENAIEISNAVLSWEPDTAAAHPTLKDISLQVRHGEHVAVCGEVGSGKSALLNCILGEIPKVSGSVSI